MQDVYFVFGNYSAHLSDIATSTGVKTYLEITYLGVTENPTSPTSPSK